MLFFEIYKLLLLIILRREELVAFAYLSRLAVIYLVFKHLSAFKIQA